MVGLELQPNPVSHEHPARVFHRTYPISLVGNALFDLMVTSEAAMFSNKELVEHVEETIHQTTRVRLPPNAEGITYAPSPWAAEQIPEFQDYLMQSYVREIYSQFCTHIWPLIKDDLHLRTTTSLAMIDVYSATFNTYRLLKDSPYGRT